MVGYDSDKWDNDPTPRIYVNKFVIYLIGAVAIGALVAIALANIVPTYISLLS